MVSVRRALTAIAIAGLMLGASDAAPQEARGAASTSVDAVATHAFAAVAATVGGIVAAREARMAYRHQANPHYLAPYLGGEGQAVAAVGGEVIGSSRG